MEEAIAELRELNRDFGSITEQIIKSLLEVCNEGSRNEYSIRRTAKSLNALQRYHRVRYASKALYSTLQAQWNCNTHHYHSFDVRVLDDDREGKGKAQAALSRYVTCELAVTHDDSSLPVKGPLHLEIHQACDSDDEDHQPQTTDDTSTQRLRRVLEMDSDRQHIKVPTSKKSWTQRFLSHFKSVSLNLPASANTVAIPQLPSLTQSIPDFYLGNQSTQPSSSSLTDLSLVDDVCKMAYDSMACCTDRSFLGSWSGPHAQWFCVPTARTTDGGSRALSDIIKWISKEPVLRSLPRPLLVELAGNVAEGIMHVYSTPWLASTDLGNNVRYSGISDSSSIAVQLKGPYFMARFHCKQAREDLVQPSINPVPCIALYSPVHFAEARNELLFNFGILMLEIGYGRPWHELKDAVTAAHGELSDYKTAEKLAGQLVNQLGLTYSKIVKKCLGCDFGLGETDLENENLQRRFLEDVVAGLQQLKDYMVEMNIAPLG